MRVLALTLAAFAGFGCNLTSLAERDSPIAVNQCEEDVPCPSGSSCSGEGRCIASQGSLSTLLFSVSAPAGQLAGQPLFRIASVQPDGGESTLSLDGVATVEGTVQATAPPGCEPATAFKAPDSVVTYRRSHDESIPARLSFYPVERMLGLPASGSTVLVDLSAASGKVPDTYPFGVRLPAGKYDIYIQPFDVTLVMTDTPAPEGCSIPPELIRGAVFDGSVRFVHRLPVPSHLELKINWSDGSSSLDNWVVDMLEPVTGRVISTRAELKLPTTMGSTLIYSAGLDYLPVLENDQQVTGSEIVRLSPPESVIAPSLLFQRSGLELFAKGAGVIDQLKAIPKPVALEGRVIDAGSGQPELASVTLTATELLGMPAGTLTSFTRSVQTREDGTFSLNVLPGTYRVLTVPAVAPNSPAPLAASETSWKIAASPERQAGRAIALSRAGTVTGRVLTPWGDAARGAMVSAEPSPGTIATDVFARSLGALPLVPRATSAVVDDEGVFSLFADPGHVDKPNLFELSVRPPSGSDFAWLLLPRLAMVSDALDLAELRLPAPVQLDLTVELSGNALSKELLVGANVRVYALLDAAGMPTNDAALAKSAVAIAESSLDELARATVMLPPSLGQP